MSIIARTRKTQTEFNQMKEEINQLLSDVSVMEADTISNRSSLSTSRDDCMRVIEGLEHEFITLIGQMREAATTELNEHFKKHMHEITNDIETCVKTKQELDTFNRHFERLSAENVEEAFLLMRIFKGMRTSYKSKTKSGYDNRKLKINFAVYKSFYSQCQSMHSFGKTEIAETLTETSGKETTSTEQNCIKSGASLKSVVEIKIGSIIDFKVDVIVNSVRNDLSLNKAAASKAIYKAAGKEMQKELKTAYPSGLHDWQIVESGPHGLGNCRKVLHGSLGKYDPDVSLQLLESFVQICLAKASTNGYVSIAFPSLGTGLRGYPKLDVAKTLFASVAAYIRSEKLLSIKKVLFVLYHKDIESIKAFQDVSNDYM